MVAIRKHFSIDNSVAVYLPSPNTQVATLFHHNGYDITEDQADADLVVFTGGPDICPFFYGQRMHPKTSFSLERDLKDRAAIDNLQPHQALVGICRGAQFLNVIVGLGSLWQHVTDHTEQHIVYYADSQGREKWFKASSTHHQMMIPGQGAHVLAWARQAKKLYSTNVQPDLVFNVTDMYDKNYVPDPEVVYYPNAPWPTLCVQYHPEYRTTDSTGTNKFFSWIEDELLNEEQVIAVSRNMMDGG